MSNPAAIEANAFTASALSALKVAAAPGGQSAASAQLSYSCGQLAATSLALLDVPATTLPSSTFWASFATCFDKCRLAGATYETMDALRLLCFSFFPQSNLGAAVSNFIMRMALAEQAQILAALTFTSRVQIDDYLDQIDSNFETAIDIAADNADTVCYQALIALLSAVVQDLSTRAAPLPVIVNVNFASSMPALTIAQRLYQDPTQVPAIVAMNGPIANPVFCPLNMNVLSFGPD